MTSDFIYFFKNNKAPEVFFGCLSRKLPEQLRMSSGPSLSDTLKITRENEICREGLTKIALRDFMSSARSFFLNFFACGLDAFSVGALPSS
jgi:hypothetical protein